MTLDRPNLKHHLSSPHATLGVGLLAALVLALLPGRWTGSLRGTAATWLRPGQTATLRLRRQGERATGWLKSHFRTAARLAEGEDDLTRLRQENRQLTAELAAVRTRLAGAAGDAPDEEAQRLLHLRCVPARVLGRQARAFLGRHHLLDVGRDAGIEPDGLVVAGGPVIDGGSDVEIEAGQLVLSGRQIWGRIIETGPNTSVVCPLTGREYRDVVSVGTGGGPQGVLEGTDEPFPRIRLVQVTEPVSVGDPVYTVAYQGVLPDPLLYGHVVRLERPVGAAHWEIWMQPAVAGQEPARVAVLRMELNSMRVAERRPIPRN